MTLPSSGSLATFRPDLTEMSIYPMLRYAERCWTYEEGKYFVTINTVNGFSHLKIRRRDDKPISEFYIFQRIKNLVLGEEVIAVQVFPKELDMVDGSNTYHLWTWEGIEAEVPNLKTMPRYH